MILDGQSFLLALGLMLFIEGMLYAFLPRETLHRLFRYLLNMPHQEFKFFAVIIASVGFAIIWYAGR